MKRLHLIGINYRQVTSEKLSEFSIDIKLIPEYLKRLLSIDGIKEAVILSTCNRTEVYFVLSEVSFNDDFFDSILKKLDFPPEKEFFYHYQGKKALAHIFKVASSLDSMIIGESEITGQFKQAFDIAFENKACGNYLRMVFNYAMSCVKRIKNATTISKGSLSVARIAIEILKEKIHSFNNKQILIVGAGYIGNLFLRILKEENSSKITISNRTLEKAQKMADIYKINFLEFPSLKKELGNFDIVILATSSSRPLFSTQEIKDIVEQRAQPSYIVDAGIPKNAPSDIREIKNCFLIDMDYIKEKREKNRLLRKKDIEVAHNIIKQQLEKFETSIFFNQILPAFEKMKKSAMIFTEQEIDKMVKIKKLDSRTQSILKSYNAMIIDKVIRRHITAVKKLLSLRKKSQKMVDILRKMVEIYDRS